MESSLLAVVKTVDDFGIDLSALWGSFRLTAGVGLFIIAVTVGIIFWRKLVS